LLKLKEIMKSVFHRIIPGICCLASIPCVAQEIPSKLDDCATISDSASRLACFDRMVAVNRQTAAPEAQSSAPVMAAPQPAAAVPAPPAAAPAIASDDESYLINHWELDQAHQRGVFKLRPHHINYLMATYTFRPNDAPYRPYRRVVPTSGDFSRNELAFQLGFKMKLVEGAFDKPLDLWFGYTQNSFWQASNSKASSPFRETNYQPELMAVTPLHFNLLGVEARFLNLGLVHQSNGQAGSLSRSWNRAYLQLGLEDGPLSVTARIWKRMHEAAEDDNNPDIIDYLGRGDLTAIYRHEGHEYSALLRHNFHTGRGATQLGWAFPIEGRLKGYVQLFSGYGQSLIDYNYFQRSVGAGVTVRY
jgi:phospholipase A1